MQWRGMHGKSGSSVSDMTKRVNGGKRGGCGRRGGGGGGGVSNIMQGQASLLTMAVVQTIVARCAYRRAAHYVCV